ncbi:hypothetical protein [Halobaculum sp. P14]|uniref:hypothetical protein n=1 Tax=Halobaculum sp. P14 TaxID=3421638 RepID=UPI003EC0CC4C
MSRNRDTDVDAALESALESALGYADREQLAPARRAVLRRERRPYGDLLVGTAEAVSGDAPGKSAVRAAAAVELLRGYCLLRCDLLADVRAAAVDAAGDDSTAGADTTASLLAGDYLQTSAYSTLGAASTDRLDDCFGTLVAVSRRMSEGFSRMHDAPSPSAAEYRSLLDATVGALGEGAAVIGATLAGADRGRRDRLAALGRQFGALRHLQFDRTAPSAGARFGVDVDCEALDDHRRRLATNLEDALGDLADAADVRRLRAAVESGLPAGSIR